MLRIAAHISRGLELLLGNGSCHGNLSLTTSLWSVLTAPASIHCRQCVLVDALGSLFTHDSLEAADNHRLQFMAPEVLEGESPSVLTDFYALGSILYALLGGALPFEGLSAARLIRASRNREFKNLRELTSGISSETLDLVHSLLDPLSRNRPQSIEEILKNLADAALGGSLEEYAGPLGVGLPAPILGREVELATIKDSLGREMPREDVTCIEIEGEQGVGVTSLLREISDWSADSGALVISGRPQRLEGSSLAEQMAGTLLPAVGKELYSPAFSSGEWSSQSGAGVNTTLLDAISIVGSRRRVLVVIDDWHACDGPELQFLVRLVNQERRRGTRRDRGAERSQLVLGGDRAALGAMHARVLQVVDVKLRLERRAGHRDVELGDEQTLRSGPGNGGDFARRSFTVCEAAEGSGVSTQGAVSVTPVVRVGGGQLPAPVAGLVLWGGGLSIAEWESLRAEFAGSPFESDTDKWVRVDGGEVHPQAAMHHSRLSLILSKAQLSRVRTAILKIKRDAWRSNDRSQLLRGLRFVAHSGGVCAKTKWRSIRAILRLLRDGANSEVEHLATLLAGLCRTSEDAQLFEVCARAARLESGLEEPRLHESVSSAHVCGFYDAWARARGLLKARYRTEARLILEELVDSGSIYAERAGVSLLEDLAIACAESRRLAQARATRKLISARIRAAWPQITRRSERRRLFDDARAARRIASWLRARQRLSLSLECFQRAASLAKRERLIHEALDDETAIAACLNNQAVAEYSAGKSRIVDRPDASVRRIERATGRRTRPRGDAEQPCTSQRDIRLGGRVDRPPASREADRGTKRALQIRDACPAPHWPDIRENVSSTRGKEGLR